MWSCQLQRLVRAAQQLHHLETVCKTNVIRLTSVPCSGCQRRWRSSSRNDEVKYSLAGLTPWGRHLKRTLSGAGSKSGDESPPGNEEKKPEAPAASSTTQTVKAPAGGQVQATIKVVPKRVRPKTDFTKSYKDNIYITPVRAMNEYLLKSSDLDGLTKYKRRSPYPEVDDIIVYQRKNVEKRAIEIWGSQENIRKERQKMIHFNEKRAEPDFLETEKAREAFRQYYKQHGATASEKPFLFHSPTGKGPYDTRRKDEIVKSGSARVVLYAVTINATNMLFKFIAWLYTGSHSMFSEFIHSTADTVNQVVLGIGIYQSLKQPDLEHPYGWANFRNVASLISGVGIFCLGAGFSIYHGLSALLHPGAIESIHWAMAILLGSFLSEGATLLIAVNEVRASARKNDMTVYEYVSRGMDPSTNVVLLEDLAAVMGVMIAGTCMGISYYTLNPLADAIGCCLVGTLLGGVASVIIYTNTISLVGRSIPAQKKLEMMRELEDDRLIRALHDVKATEMGGNHVRFKAEVDFDGREVTRLYLEKQDLDKLLQDFKNCKTLEDVENIMLRHGESIVDTLGGEVDRIEKQLKKKHPEIRHVDLEQL